MNPLTRSLNKTTYYMAPIKCQCRWDWNYMGAIWYVLSFDYLVNEYILWISMFNCFMDQENNLKSKEISVLCEV